MAIIREFLGWNEPLLLKAVQYLCHNYATRAMLDLSRVTCALPGKRAGRKLLELLAMEGEKLSVPVIPPRIITSGSLPEYLLRIPVRFESTLLSQCLWRDTLLKTSSDSILKLFPHLSRKKDRDLESYAWELARYLDSLRGEVGAAGKRFADVVPAVTSASSEERWQILSNLEESFISLGNSLGLSDKLERRLRALASAPPKNDSILYLIGVIDCNGVSKAALSACTGEVRALIGAPPEEAHLFDEFGSVLEKAWSKKTISISNDQIAFGSTLTDEAALLTAELSKIQKVINLSKVSLGLADESMIPILSEELILAGVKLRPPEGRRLADSLPATYLELIAEFCEEPTVNRLGSLVRHPFATANIGESEYRDVLSKLDNYQLKHLQGDASEKLFGDSSVSGLASKLTFIWSQKRLLGKDLKPISHWREPISSILTEVCPKVLLEGDGIKEPVEAFANFFNDIELIPDNLMPIVSGPRAIHMALQSLGSGALPPTETGPTLEAVGWLELLLDDASHIYVTGFHEQAVPEAINEDPLLPDSLRSKIGIGSNGSRYARDAYVATALINSRAKVKFLFSRTAADGTSRGPSRLLYACREEDLISRVNLILEPGTKVVSEKSALSELEWFSELKPKPLEELSILSVTDFKEYLNCPYTFYLSRKLRLHRVDDSARELDSLSFGTIIHDILKRFAVSPAREERDSKVIFDHLLSLLSDIWEERFGATALPAVYVQREIISERLRVWGAIQAQQIADGWQINQTEVSVGPRVLELPLSSGEKISVVGRIDRIDYNPVQKRYRIIDYKTSQRKTTLSQGYVTKRGVWKDLQLPLYYYMGKGLGLSEEIELAYWNLPATHGEAGIEVADWKEEILESALVEAKRIAGLIISGQFWPINPKNEPFDEGISSILSQVRFVGGGNEA